MISNDNPDEFAAKLLGLHPDWWQTAATTSVLIKAFKKHIIPLLVAGTVGHESQYNIYTGIILKYSGPILWLTAGHVVDELSKILSSSQFKLTEMAWLDGYEVTKAEAVLVHRTDIPMKSWSEIGLDVGIILPSILDVGNILRNDNVIPIDARIWKNLNQASPEGYYAIGFPRPWSHLSQTPLSNNKVLKTVDANIACLPLKEIPPPPEFRDDPVWSNPEAFYGQILPYPDYPDFNFEDAKGMSGGPILSVERDPGGTIRYRLEGIIQSFAPSQFIFRAEPIQRIAEVLDLWLEEKNHTTKNSNHSIPT